MNQNLSLYINIKNNTKIEYENGSLILKFGLENGEVKSINFIRLTPQ